MATDKYHSLPMPPTQICKFQVGSNSYDKSRMMFDVSTLGYIRKAQSIILDYDITIRNIKRKDQIFDAGALGNFSLAGFEMTLKCHFLSYIITYYLPSGLFVAVSWISFLIPPDIVPGRMALLITLFLVLVNIFNNVNTNSLKAEGLTAIEIWMLACILFVFGALIVYAVILNEMLSASTPRRKKRIKRDNKMEQQKIIKMKNGSVGSQEKDPYPEEDGAVLLSCNNDQSGGQLRHSLSRAEKKPGKKISTNYQYAKVDRFFLFFSPFPFLIFNTIYWGYFLLCDKLLFKEQGSQ